MGKLFGTDGIRGVANVDLDIDLAMKIGQAVGIVMGEEKGSAPVFVIGKDTRLSSDMLESALVAGLCASGADVAVLGVVPTPAVAYITARSKADAGIVISASHNPFQDNGIKIFNGLGFKLSDELEGRVEDLILSDSPLPLQTCEKIGKVLRKNQDWVEQYIDHLTSAAVCDLSGLKVFIDCSNGAAARTASRLFTRFKLDLEIIKDHPNGTNINDNCGSTDTSFLSRAVVSGGYDIGIAFDGDADRCIIVDEKGNTVDGDKIMGVCGLALKREGKLAKDTIVATVMSNLGFHDFAAQNGISLVCTAVGDRNVLEKMLEGGYVLGGEQSGHIIFLDYATTGDGQLAALQFLNVLAVSGKPVSELVGAIPNYPQVLINVPIEGGNAAKEAVMASDALQAAISEAETALGGKGRVLVRPSGTEPKIRVMVEAETQGIADETAGRLAELVKTL
ncbi:MAG: phosphoglucosamine mutase [Oscillospiraceae bacterium]|nr:phosphoglucosamine mutase [Oscillospiraceae bacterium]